MWTIRLWLQHTKLSSSRQGYGKCPGPFLGPFLLRPPHLKPLWNFKENSTIIEKSRYSGDLQSTTTFLKSVMNRGKERKTFLNKSALKFSSSCR